LKKILDFIFFVRIIKNRSLKYGDELVSTGYMILLSARLCECGTVKTLKTLNANDNSVNFDYALAA